MLLWLIFTLSIYIFVEYNFSIGRVLAVLVCTASTNDRLQMYFKSLEAKYNASEILYDSDAKLPAVHNNLVGTGCRVSGEGQRRLIHGAKASIPY